MNSAIFSAIDHVTASGETDASRADVRALGEKYATRTLNILQLNINGTQRKTEELSDILYQNHIHVACLQETKLNPNLTLRIKGYTTIRKDRKDRTGGGLAFLVKQRDIKYKICPDITNRNSDSNTEAQAIDIFLPRHSLRIVNVYHPDNTEIDVDLLYDLVNTTNDTHIMLGDFNAKSPSWGSPVLDQKGSQIEDLLIDTNFAVLNNNQVTYVSKSNGAASAPDITTINHQHEQLTSWNVLSCAISDHFPILTKVNLALDRPEQRKRSWNFRKADWPKFTSKLEEFCDLIGPSSLNNMVSSFNSFVQQSAKLSIPRGKRKTNWVPYWKDNHIEALISDRDTLCADFQSNNTEENRRKYINSCQRVEEEISLCKRQKWEEFCATLDPRKSSQHWNIIKTLNNRVPHPLQNTQETNSINCRGKLARTNLESANMLAEYYANNSKLVFSKTDKATLKTTRRLIKGSFKPHKNSIFSDTFTIEEFDSALFELDPKKAPGADLIFGSMIQNFGQKAKRKLLDIFNLSWSSGKLPKIWKTSIVVPILKAGKNASDCKSYRPISLTSTLCKLMERMIHSRIMNWLIKERKLHFYQTAYRANHSTVDQLFYLCQSVIDGLQNKPHKKTVAVFLDLSSAFDRVWRQKLVNIVHEVGIGGHALVWINDFLRNRHFSVRFNGELSKTRKTYAGVPQGSVLSPLLFLLYMNTVDAYIHKDTKIACYADDIAIWSTNHDLKTSQKTLNLSLKGIATWADDLKLTINPNKSNYCVFSTDRKNRGTFQPILKIQNTIIERVQNPKYLGVILDPELRFTKHMKTTANKGLKKLNILRKLCGTNWGSRSSTLKNTYCTVIRPVLEYCSPIWAHASKSVKDTLDSVQHRASKIIIGAVSSTNNTKAELESGLVFLENRRKLATLKFTNKIRSHNKDHIAHRAFDTWTGRSRLQRSSTLHFDSDIRGAIQLDHSTLEISQEPLFPSKPPMNTKINCSLLEPCSKKEPIQVLLQKGEDTVRSLSREGSVIIYTDGSSDIDCNRGGAGISITYPSGNKVKLKVPTGLVASNFTSELIAIKEALFHCRSHSLNDPIKEIVLFSDSKSALEAIHHGKTTITQEIFSLLHLLNIPCTLQWIPAHVGIEGNECADALAKEARDDDQPRVVTCADANAVARRRIYNQHFSKATIPNLNCPRNLSSIIARLRTGHFKGMKISQTNIKSYPTCKYCPQSQLTPEHVFDCQAIIGALFQLGAPPFEILHCHRAPELADLIAKTFGGL